jgi:hypothetical protein
VVGQPGEKSPIGCAAPYQNQQISRPENLPGFGNQRTMKRAPKTGRNKLIIVKLSGRGDKDVSQVVAKVKLEMPK